MRNGCLFSNGKCEINGETNVHFTYHMHERQHFWSFQTFFFAPLPKKWVPSIRVALGPGVQGSKSSYLTPQSQKRNKCIHDVLLDDIRPGRTAPNILHPGDDQPLCTLRSVCRRQPRQCRQHCANVLHILKRDTIRTPLLFNRINTRG